MSSASISEVEDSKNENDVSTDCKPIIPLRQRKLPASFWQEPSIAPSPEVARVNFRHPAFMPTHPAALQPWPTSLVPPIFPQTLVRGLEFASPLPHLWIRNPIACCSCQACLNYSCVVPRQSEMYSDFSYRQVQCGCPDSGCADRNCKLCNTLSNHWHPERHARLRSLRYNALLDG